MGKRLVLAGLGLLLAVTVRAGEPEVQYHASDPDLQLPFSDAVRVGDMLYLSGQIGMIELDDGQYYLKAGIDNPNGVDTVDLSEFDIEKYFLANSQEDIAPFRSEFESTDFIWVTGGPY